MTITMRHFATVDEDGTSRTLAVEVDPDRLTLITLDTLSLIAQGDPDYPIPVIGGDSDAVVVQWSDLHPRLLALGFGEVEGE